MQPVRKNASPDHRKRLLAGLIAALFLAVALMIYFNREQKIPELETHADEERVSLINRETDELVGMEVTSSRGDRFTILRENQGFIVEGQPDFSLDEHQIDLMVKDLTKLSANELAGEVHLDESSLAHLGLGQDAPRVSATYSDGEQLTLVFGNSAQTEIPADYLLIAGDNKVYTVSPETRDHFDRTQNTLHPVPAVNFSSSLVDKAIFSGQGAFSLHQQDGLWEVTDPFLYPADSNQVRALLSSIGNMRFAVYAGEATQENLVRFGLEHPRRTITFYLSASTIISYDSQGMPLDSQNLVSQNLTISVGDDIDSIGLYCLYDGKIYQASNASMGFLQDTGLPGILSVAPVTLPVNRLHSLKVEEKGETREYRIDFTEKILPNNEIERDEAGNTLYEPFVSLNSEETESENFLMEYLKLMGLQRSGRLPEGFSANEEAPARRYLFMLQDGTRELALFPYDALHYAMRVNGTFMDYVSRALADEIAL